ncbi:replication protein A, subunit RPA32 [Fistulina hepatica ATCC 64428]|nr:replication protein A, subunit RPA32 [Fistulina hepatica ATCC 64428]
MVSTGTTDSDNPYYGNTGGGFLAGGSPMNTDSPSSGRRSEASNAVRPVTILQLMTATQQHADADWMVDDRELGHATVVGNVVEVKAQTTNTVFIIEDGTGMIEARSWADHGDGDDDGQASKFNGIEAGKYARVTGTFKQFGSKRYIAATFIRPVADFHEPIFHMLETMMVSKILKGGVSSSAIASNTSPQGGASSAYTTDGAATSEALKDEFSTLTVMQRKIMQYMVSESSEEGVHIGAIARHVGGGNQSASHAQTISDALDSLLDNGLVYTTIDESHFRVSA